VCLRFGLRVVMFVKKQSKIEKKAVHKQTDEGRLQYAMQRQYKQKMGTDVVNIYVWLICKPIEP
jgi:hypothetical protein